jgi:hypothetical protein
MRSTLGGGNAVQDAEEVVALACRALAIDQYIARSACKPTNAVTVVEHEARQIADHVGNGDRLISGKERRGI